MKGIPSKKTSSAAGPAATTLGLRTSHANLYGHNYIADILEGGTVGSLYNGDNTNSSEGGQAKYGIVGNCISENYSSSMECMRVMVMAIIIVCRPAEE